MKMIMAPKRWPVSFVPIGSSISNVRFSRRSTDQLIHNDKMGVSQLRLNQEVAQIAQFNGTRWLPFFPETMFVCCNPDTRPQQQIIHTAWIELEGMYNRTATAGTVVGAAADGDM